MSLLIRNNQSNSNWSNQRSNSMQRQSAMANNNMNNSPMLNQQQQQSVGGHFDIENPDKKCTRGMYFSIKGSLLTFAANPKKAKYKLFCKYASTYRKGTDPIGSKRVGVPEKTIYFKAVLKWVKNTFPFDVILQSNHFRGNCYGNDKRGFWFCPAASCKKYDRQIHYPHKSTYSKNVKRFYNVDEESLKAQSIFDHATNSTVHMVSVTNPIYGVLRNNQKNSECPYDLKAMHRDKYYAWVPPNIYQSAVNAVKNKVLKSMPTKNALKTFVRVERASGSWSSDVTGCGSVSSGILQNTIYECSGLIEISFTNHQ